MRLSPRLRALYDRWLRRRIPPSRQVLLDQRRIFIFPTAYGFFYLLIAVALFIGGINYENNLVIGFSFLLASLFVVAILHTFRNFSGVQLRAGGQHPGFAGSQGELEVVLSAGDRHWHRSLWLRWPGGQVQEASVGPGRDHNIWLDLPLPHRGRVHPGRLRIQTRYPLGLLRAWSLVDLDHWCLAWPKPWPGGVAPATGGDEEQGKRTRIGGNDDFQGLRNYVAGDSLRLVDWKAFARGQGLNTKVFDQPAEGRRWLDWDMLEGQPFEVRLSRLTWWVLEFERENRPLGLRLPGKEVPPGQGVEHRRTLLDTLALYGEPDADGGNG
jgi:uncharacterized protein (DUF58 family)